MANPCIIAIEYGSVIKIQDSLRDSVSGWLSEFCRAWGTFHTPVIVTIPKKN